jgi:hypothetical protein
MSHLSKRIFLVALYCVEMVKIMLESNKCILSKYGAFVGKGYVRGGLFRLCLLDDACNKVVNNVLIPDNSNI